VGPGNSHVNTDSHAKVGARPWSKTTRALTWVLVAVGFLLGALVTLYWSSDGGLFHRKGFGTSAAGVLVLEDCDSDFRTPPFEDAVITFGANGEPVRKVTGLNIAETVGGCRSLSVSRDGRFFTVCENVANKLTAYQLDTGERLWSLHGEFTTATVSQSGVIYALTSAGTIYGKGNILRSRGVRTASSTSRLRAKLSTRSACRLRRFASEWIGPTGVSGSLA
jgi:hypothetical protein